MFLFITQRSPDTECEDDDGCGEVMGEMIKLIPVGGFPESGKTELILELVERLQGSRLGVVVNNNRSLEYLRSRFPDIPSVSFPMTAPCGRARQFSGTLEKFISNNDVDIIITEPSGSCMETMAPLLNPMVAFKKESIAVAPLFTVVRNDVLKADGLNGNTADGLRLKRQIDEADAAVIVGCDDEDDDVIETIKKINPDCQILFKGSDTTVMISEMIRSDGKYTRALFN